MLVAKYNTMILYNITIITLSIVLLYDIIVLKSFFLRIFLKAFSFGLFYVLLIITIDIVINSIFITMSIVIINNN